VRACAVETHVNMSQETAEEPLYTEIYRKNAAAQIEPERGHTFGASLCSRNSFQHFTRDISQKSHFLQKFAGKMPRPRLGPERGHTLCASLHSRNACQDFIRKFTGKMPQTKTAPQTLREPAQSKRMSTFQKRQQKSHFIRKFTGKMPQAKTTPQTLCEPAQSTHMSRFHKSHFMRKFTGKVLQTKMSPERRRTLCASLRSRNACQDFTRATLYGNLQIKCHRPE